MTMQVAAVTKPLGSVRAFVKAGNKVVFDSGGSYIENKGNGVRTNIEDRNGAYVFDLWIPRTETGNEDRRQGGYQGKLWQAFAGVPIATTARSNRELRSAGGQQHVDVA